MHGAKAGLALHDITVSNHRGLASMFGLRIVQTGLVEGHWGSVIGQLSAQRMAADYDVRAVFTEADAASAYAQADGFVNRIRALLTGPRIP